MLGVGGGFLMVPLQVMLARTRQVEATANSLTAIVPISITGILIYYFGGFLGQRGAPQVDFRFALLLAAGGVFGAFVGARLTSRMPDIWLARGVAVVLGAVGVKQVLFP
ncbi:sulfite exporter TauE/SafE family protein [Candidatus Dormiibacter inghamiae]|uniref:sulfite exporter TauE/SafE family protein n=1 Tax=Candidatus Dormiibacter inghamiae TaxID=3127013 RepID=UPI0030C75C8D